jgi:hypothetical protein
MKCKVPIRKALTLLDKRMEGGVDMLKEYSQSLSSILGASKVSEIEKEIFIWHDENQELLESLFEGTEPLIRYMPIDYVDAFQHVTLSPPWFTSSNTPTISKRQFLVKQLKVLADLYRELEQMCGTPLVYIDSKKQVRFMDKVCQLGTNNLGVYLVQYMFENHDFYEQVPVDTLLEKLETKASSLTNAVDSVNKRARDSFGFNIFSRPRGVVILIDETPIKL